MDYLASETPMSLVCSTLRSRQPWSSVPTLLLQSDSRTWHESSLLSHDISLTIEQEHAGTFDIHKFVLLSKTDLETEEPTVPTRITQLCQDLGDARAGVIFLLDQDNEQEHGDAMKAFMELQIKLMDYTPNIPILLLTSLDALPATLKTFQDNFAESVDDGIQQQVKIDIPEDLLGCCSTGENMLSTQAINTLVRKQVIFGFRDLLDGDKLENHEGHRMVKETLGPEDAKRFLRFWTR
ncbi:hypothetical protein QBC40DRAFT_177165 [Triangularia verruculosa]|uniref:Uncharacterized protein n=1 Tax=Triangularia verruculosa TaxID=2587418 RepID=A0AAN7AVM4_9PEZI|nr:hypothetical protein QBC40DRAFT_177165 [Triangularia verruculosa]